MDQLSAAVRAIEAKAKVSGLLVQKVEVGQPNSFAELDTVDEVVNACLKGYITGGYQFTDAERAEFKRLMLSHVDRTNEFLASCAARPVRVIEGNSPADIRDRELRRQRDSRSLAAPEPL